ncbi:hypothetical protein ZIOFF_067797 [Zingiber officinale]|uniref:protein-serine/threonine phosphatase n=1 Tax=Zingiber officinale TaxID=94328 RepID=A0A8J5CG28_ZINOF|nr:hypothetical protein ZIOFF_067797 [Zingiber officinale]
MKKPELSDDALYQKLAAPVPLTRPVVTAEPSIRIRDLKKNDLFLIFASDGLWEHLSDEAAVDIGIAKRLVQAVVAEAAKKREMRYDDIKHVEKGIRQLVHDDITVIVINLNHGGNGDGEEGEGSKFEGGNVDCTNAPTDIFSLHAA